MNHGATTAERAAIRCETCGTPWTAHTDECSRHAYRPGPTLDEAAHALYVHLGCGVHPHWVQCIGKCPVGQYNDTASIVVMLVREPRHFEGAIPETWQGYPVESKVVGQIRLGRSDDRD